MDVTYDIPRTIGICGAATCGKDTLCEALVLAIGQNKARRFSIAGDQIRKDLSPLISKSMEWDMFALYPEQKEVVRPLMVEYGRMMRNTTQGQYFISKLENHKEFQETPIRIIPDIRYDDFLRDERSWLKDKMGGFLIYIERQGIGPSNKYEAENLQRLRLWSDYIVRWDTLQDIGRDSLIIAKDILNSQFLVTTS